MPKTFLNHFAFGGLITFAVGSVTRRTFVEIEKLDAYTWPSNTDVFFGPSMYQTPDPEKIGVLGSKALWVDVDDPTKPVATFPPSATVFSGHGWHFYWFLKEPILTHEKIEGLNKILIADIANADKGSWNVNRILRVPGTVNTKNPEAHVNVELKDFRPSLVYDLDDFEVLNRLSKKDKHKIATGDSRGYRSRSERDWAILSALVLAGASDELITKLFDIQPCGEKHKENPHYLAHTLEVVRAKPATAIIDDEPQQDEEGYFVTTRRGKKRISTFVFDPEVLLDGSPFGAPDALVGTVKADGYSWGGVTFSRGAFTSVSRFDREAPVAAWQWLGHDDDIRKLLPYLLTQLKQKGLPKVAASPTVGLHNINGKWLFLGTQQALSKDALWQGFSGPVCWLPTQREGPKIVLETDIKPDEVAFVAEHLPKLNHPMVIWPMIGWYTATCLKPWLEQNGYRFPVLNVSGTKGSGKTTLIQRVFMPLMGQVDCKTFDANTTRFVVLSLLGSSNASPVAFSEFRFGQVATFLRYILLAYDTGHDPRGRGDQTIVDYPLTAPFSVDGEDLIEDPAARERVVVALLNPDTVEEGGPAYESFNLLRNKIPSAFGGFLIQQILSKEPEWTKLLMQCREEIFTAFPGKLPDRVRNNHILVWFGVRLWCAIVGVEAPSPEVMGGSIGSVFDIKTGRAKTMCDSFIEDVVNAVAQGNAYFTHVYDGNAEDPTLWFQVASTHTWWITSRRRQGRGSLERDAIRAQLKEAPYIKPPQVQRDVWMFGVGLKQAAELGLDLPTKLSDTSFVIRL